jgi:hypothetical protein
VQIDSFRSHVWREVFRRDTIEHGLSPLDERSYRSPQLSRTACQLFVLVDDGSLLLVGLPAIEVAGTLSDFVAK